MDTLACQRAAQGWEFQRGGWREAPLDAALALGEVGTQELLSHIGLKPIQPG